MAFKRGLTIEVDQGFDGFKRALHNRLNGSFAKAAKELEKSMKKKFSKSGRVRGASGSLQYPHMVRGHARDSIVVDFQHTFGKDATITVRTKGRWGKRLASLSREKTYPKRSGFYTIPVSWRARKHASNGGSARSMGLVMKRVTYKDRTGLALVTKARGKGGDHRQGSMRMRNTFGVHYMLVRQWKRKARLGIEYAFLEDKRILTDVLGGTLL